MSHIQFRSVESRRQVRRNHRFTISLFIIGGLLLLAAILLQLNANHSTPKPPAGALHNAPSSVRPIAKAVDAYRVPADNPRYLAIPKLGLTKTRIMALNQQANGEIATPNNIFDAGWYTRSSLPGAPGAMFIYGHVSSWKAKGSFYNLKTLIIGDKVSVSRGDGKILTYQVTGSKIYDYQHVDMHHVLMPSNPRKPGLNLMTCTGSVIKGTSEFNQRLVVFTSLES